MSKNDFKSPFGDGSDGMLNACVGLNGGPYNYRDYAYGYYEAGNTISTKVIETKQGMDTAIYPIIYLYRHALELSLKHIVLQHSRTTLRGHKLEPLWQEAKKDVVCLVHPEEKGIFAKLEETVKNFEQIDPIAEAGRYPEGVKGDRHQTLEDLRIINIEPIYDQMQSVREIFDFLEYCLYNHKCQ